MAAGAFGEEIPMLPVIEAIARLGVALLQQAWDGQQRE
jgi:hypothetical protein